MPLIEAFHSGSEEDLRPKPVLHVGTRPQAEMRGGKILHRVTFATPIRMPRLKDIGSWKRDKLVRHARSAAAIVYLNRFEGIPLEEFEAARAKADIDDLPDARFRKLLPSAHDSWIILESSIIREITRC